MISKGTKAAIVVFLVGSFILLSVLVGKQARNSREGSQGIGDFGTRADIAIKDLTIYQTLKGEVEWEIHAQSAEWFEQEDRLDLVQARAGMASGPGMEIRIAGDRGTVDTRSYNLSLANEDEDMKVELSNGYTLLTKTLEWNNRDREIRSGDPVRIFGPDFSVGGSGFRFNAPEEEITVLRNVNVRFNR